jgi:Ni/Co efflux regulator RcnB
MERPPAKGEPHPGPHGYTRVTEPHGWDARPAAVDKPAFQHNFQAARTYHIGVYHRPVGWVAHRWGYGQILPRGYWAAPFILADYWLFALEVPPAGYEWVRDDTDAILVNVSTGEILQVEYGVFALRILTRTRGAPGTAARRASARSVSAFSGCEFRQSLH